MALLRLADPKFAPVKEAIRVLFRFIYVQIEDTTDLLSALSEDSTTLWPFATTSEGTWRGAAWLLKQQGDVRTPEGVLSLIVAGDPKNCVALGVVEVTSEDTLRDPKIVDHISTLAQLNIESDHTIKIMVCVGKLPPTRAVPENLRDLFHPIKLPPEEGRKEIDTRTRTKPASADDVDRLLSRLWRALNYADPRPDIAPEALKRVEGLSLHEITNIVSLSLYRWAHNPAAPKPMKERTLEESQQGFASLLNPDVIEMYRNRWARVP